jgi:hypothetical protein
MASEATAITDQHQHHIAQDEPPRYTPTAAETSKPLPPVPAGAPTDATGEDDDSEDLSFSSIFASIPPGTDLNTTAPLPKDIQIPAVFLGIPFPPAQHASNDEKHMKKRPALLLYAPPRAPYRKPPPDENGKTKQKFVKRIERGWQQEVEEGQRIHEGKEPNASRWKKTKGPLARVNIPSSVISRAHIDRRFAESCSVHPMAPR